MRKIQNATIYLTDQVLGHPNIRPISKHIMFSVADFYKNPTKANGYRDTFTGEHRLAEDSGGFQFLMGKLPLKDCDPMKTVEIYKRIGVKEGDFPIQLDLPPRWALGKQETKAIIRKSAEFYHVMTSQIPYVIPVVHGWKIEELKLSLELIEDPDRLASATNIPSSVRTKDVMSAGSNQSVADSGSQYILKHITSNKSHIAAPGGDIGGSIVVDHLKKDKVAAGTNLPMTREKQWVMGHLNPHSSVKDRVAAGSFNVMNAPQIEFTGGKTPKIMGAGAMSLSTSVVDNVISSRPRAIAAGANQQSGLEVLNYVGTNRIATPAAAAEEIITTIDKANTKKGGIPKKHRAPKKVVEERLAMVLNLLRHKELFILGGASPHFQHIIFMGGAKYSDTSSWRLKAYMASIYIPEIGARSIGYKETDKRLRKEEIPLLEACLKDPTHPLNGMPAKNFLALGRMNVKGYYKTVKKEQWPCKPFDLRALHNAWVLKFAEEQIANEYACDPDRYFRYLINRRFKGHPNLTRRCKRIWGLLKRPYVQTDLQTFLLSKRR